jgi:putative transcriptional regulator
MKNHLKERREALGLSQQQLAEKVDVSRQMISYIEKGEKKPNIILALKIAEYFNCAVTDIFELEQED